MKRARLGDPNLDLRPSFKGQVLASIIVPQFPVVYSTTVATGVISAALAVDPVTLSYGWATRFGALYEEFRIVKCKAVINFFSSTNPGQINFWWDEVANTAPTVAAAAERTVLRLAAGSNQSRHVISWTPSDLKDLQYSPVGTSVNPVYLKIYTDNANYGATAVATQYMTIQLLATIQFRGLHT